MLSELQVCQEIQSLNVVTLLRSSKLKLGVGLIGAFRSKLSLIERIQ